jgi:hypothetical protein
VAASTELGLVNGYEDNTFRPAGIITRAEVAAILSRLLGLRPEFAPMVTFSPQPYTDPIPAWAEAHINRVSAAGVFQGFPDSTFRAAEPTTRAQVSTVFFRMLGRYGGEEFCIVLPQTSLSEAGVIAERMRQRVAEKVYPHGKSQPLGTVSVSIGISTFAKNVDTAEKVIAAADRALYNAKLKGKNRIEFYLES